jgi:acetyl-CoA synthetase
VAASCAIAAAVQHGCWLLLEDIVLVDCCTTFNHLNFMTNHSASAFVDARDLLLRLRNDYQRAYDEFQWPTLSHFNWALDYFDPMARGNQTLALWVVDESGEEQKLTYEQMSLRSNQVANYLRRLGVQRGERILLMLGNEVALWEIMLAAIKLGAVVSPATTLLTEDDLRDRLQRGRVTHVVAGVASAAKFDPIEGDFNRIVVGGARTGWHRYDESGQESEAFAADGPTLAGDPMLLYFTSGTTARPKLVMHTHQSYPIGHLSTMYWIGLKPADVHWNISSPGWAKHAWSCFFAPFNAGATVFIYNYARFAAKQVLAALTKYPVTTLCAPPTVWRMLIQEPMKQYHTTLREVIGAGEPLNPEIIDQVHAAWGLQLRDGYGQTETTAQIGNTPGQHVKPGSMGRALPGYRVVLLDTDGKPAQEGEVCLDLAGSPISLMAGYEDDAGKTADAMRHGAYHTGDVASRDADGYITYVGRSDDVFKASDYRISPFELESVLIEHPFVAEAAVVPSPDALRLAVPKAYIVLVQGCEACEATALAIFSFARDRLAAYKRIRRLEFADLPKTISGKIRRVELRQREETRDSKAPFATEYRFEDFAELRER